MNQLNYSLSPDPPINPRKLDITPTCLSVHPFTLHLHPSLCQYPRRSQYVAARSCLTASISRGFVSLVCCVSSVVFFTDFN